MRKIKVLIVDDHALMRDGISALLNVNDDIEVIGEASEGKEAIKKMGELKPDVVVMDIAMPNMDGMEATRQIVKVNREVKVLILTQHENKEYVLSAIKAGASGFVPKKALGSELVSAIRSVYRPWATWPVARGSRRSSWSGSGRPRSTTFRSRPSSTTASTDAS